MLGTIVVQEGGSGGGGEGGGGAAVPQVPDSARSLGIVSLVLMLSVLGLSYFFMKFGGDYGSREE